MPAYHSILNKETGFAELCGCMVVPLKTKSRGPAPIVDPSEPSEDIVDEAIKTFRANVLFSNFEVQGSADRVLIYLSLFIHQVLKKASKLPSKTEALRQIMPVASGPHLMPGEAGWPLGTLIAAPKSAGDMDNLRGYFKQLRETLTVRLLDRIYNVDGTPNKHWLLFAKRKFLNKEFL